MVRAYESFEDKIKKLATYSLVYDTITFNEIVSILGHSSNYIIILFLVAPFLQPIPLFGLSSVCGLLVFFSGFRIVIDKPFFLPRFAKRMAISQQTVQKICRWLERLFEMTDTWIKPQGRFMSRHLLVRRLNGSVICLLGLLLASPLPIPFTNTLPSLGLIALCLGTLKEDGVIIGLGWLLAAISVAYVSVTTILPITLILGWLS